MLTVVLGLCALLCAAYGIVLVVYAGFSSAWLWGALTVFLGALSWGSRFYQLHRKKIPLWIPVSVVTFCLACLAIFISIEVMIFLGAAGSEEPGLDYVIVLGAKVRPDGVSNSLKKRLDKAIEYAQDNPETIFVLSGGKGPDEPISEAEAMRNYMVYNGIPQDKILLETNSTSTVENIAYSRLVIESDRTERKRSRQEAQNLISLPSGSYVTAPDKPTRIGILTNDFHIFRAKKIAQKWGIKDAVGISAPSDPILFIHSCIREALAVFKDRLMGNM